MQRGISITNRKVREYRASLEALITDAEADGSVGHCAVALAFSLNSLLSRYSPTHVDLDHIEPTRLMMQGISNVVGGDKTTITQKKLIKGFTQLMAIFHRTVVVSDPKPPKPR